MSAPSAAFRRLARGVRRSVHAARHFLQGYLGLAGAPGATPPAAAADPAAARHILEERAARRRSCC